MCFVGVPADSMKDMYTLSPGTAHASLSTCNSIMWAGTTGAVAAGGAAVATGAVAAGTDYGQAHAERHGYGCCHGGQARVEPTFVRCHDHTLVELLWVGRRRRAPGRRRQART